MCLTIPGKIKSIQKGIATVENGTRTEQIELGVVLDAKVGDWILYATNRAVRRIDEQEAREIIELLEDNYQPVDVIALPQRYKQVVYKVRRDKFVGAKNQKSKVKNQKNNSTLEDEEIKKLRDQDKQENILKAESSKLKAINKQDLEYLLNLQGRNNLEALYSEANVLRKEVIEDFVCIHGIVEFSNYCKNNCLYCGIGREANIRRYRMTPDEIYQAVKTAVDVEGYKLIVLQSGEDKYYSDNDLVHLIDRIKNNMRVFVFLSVGERSKKFYKSAFEAGAHGSLFRFETSNPKLYGIMHPGHNLDQRLESLQMQISLGYYMASGGLIGLPGQTMTDMAEDLLLVKKLGVPMLSSGPYISSKNNMLEKSNFQFSISNQLSSFNDKKEKLKAKSYKLEADEKLRLTLNYIAAARLLMPEIKIPVTTALETLDPESGRHKGLLAGANALMFNVTPPKYRDDYNLYDHKYIEREKVWQKYGLFKGEESYEMLEERLQI